MNVEIGAEAALFPEKEYIKEIFVAVYLFQDRNNCLAVKERRIPGKENNCPFNSSGY
jgi:hypothetical protein